MAAAIHTPRYNRSAIMAEAWRLVRKANLAKFGLRLILRNALRTAWNKAKTEARYAALRFTTAENAIRVIEAKERLSAADVAEVERLRRKAVAEGSLGAWARRAS